MNYYAVLYSLDGLIARSERHNKRAGKGGKLPIRYRHIGFFLRKDDGVMTAKAMLKASQVVSQFIFHVEKERWCLYNENEFKNLLSELKIKIPKGGLHE